MLIKFDSFILSNFCAFAVAQPLDTFSIMNDLKMVMRIKDIHRALFALCSARFFIIFTHNSPPLLVDAMTIDSVVIIIIRGIVQ